MHCSVGGLGDIVMYVVVRWSMVCSSWKKKPHEGEREGTERVGAGLVALVFFGGCSQCVCKLFFVVLGAVFVMKAVSG